jgi:hypothetical protein
LMMAPEGPADSPTEFCAARRSLRPESLGGLPGVGGAFRVCGVFATVADDHSAVSPASLQVADRWPSPPALLGLSPRSWECDVNLRGTSYLNAPWGRVTSGPALVTFASPSETLSGVRGPFSGSSSSSSPVGPEASWLGGARSARDRDSSLGVVNDRPSVDMHTQRPLLVGPRSEELPGPHGPRGARRVRDTASTFGPELPPSGLVPPLSFLPTSTVFSAGYVAGLLQPAADHGVRHVSGPRPSCCGGIRRSRCVPVGLGLPRGEGARLPSADRPGLRRGTSSGVRQRQRTWYRVRSRWRHTLRSFPLASSRATSP